MERLIAAALSIILTVQLSACTGSEQFTPDKRPAESIAIEELPRQTTTSVEAALEEMVRAAEAVVPGGSQKFLRINLNPANLESQLRFSIATSETEALTFMSFRYPRPQWQIQKEERRHWQETTFSAADIQVSADAFLEQSASSARERGYEVLWVGLVIDFPVDKPIYEDEADEIPLLQARGLAEHSPFGERTYLTYEIRADGLFPPPWFDPGDVSFVLQDAEAVARQLRIEGDLKVKSLSALRIAPVEAHDLLQLPSAPYPAGYRFRGAGLNGGFSFQHHVGCFPRGYNMLYGTDYGYDTMLGLDSVREHAAEIQEALPDYPSPAAWNVHDTGEAQEAHVIAEPNGEISFTLQF